LPARNESVAVWSWPHWGPPWTPEGESSYDLSVNRRADVKIENFRGASMAGLGLDYDSIRDINPGVIYCSITGFGAAGGAQMPGYDLVVQAVSGLMSLTEPDADTLAKNGFAIADVLTGLHAAVGILAAGCRPRRVTPP